VTQQLAANGLISGQYQRQPSSAWRNGWRLAAAAAGGGGMKAENGGESENGGRTWRNGAYRGNGVIGSGVMAAK